MAFDRVQQLTVQRNTKRSRYTHLDRMTTFAMLGNCTNWLSVESHTQLHKSPPERPNCNRKTGRVEAAETGRAFFMGMMFAKLPCIFQSPIAKTRVVER